MKFIELFFLSRWSTETNQVRRASFGSHRIVCMIDLCRHNVVLVLKYICKYAMIFIDFVRLHLRF
jgi:hypothetical protein